MISTKFLISGVISSPDLVLAVRGQKKWEGKGEEETRSPGDLVTSFPVFKPGLHWCDKHKHKHKCDTYTRA